MARILPEMWTRGSGKRLRGKAHAIAVAAYLCSAPAANVIGLYYLPIVTICHDLGFQEREVRGAIVQIQEAEFALYDPDAEIVWILNAALFQLDWPLTEGDRQLALAALLAVGEHPFAGLFAARYPEITKSGGPHGGGHGPHKVASAGPTGPAGLSAMQAFITSQSLSQASIAAQSSILTAPPEDIPITQEILMRCAERGYPIPKKEHVTACLDNARARGHLRPSWDWELIEWMRREKEYGARRRDSPSQPRVEARPYHSEAPRKDWRDEIDPAENKRNAEAALAAIEAMSKGKKS